MPERHAGLGAGEDAAAPPVVGSEVWERALLRRSKEGDGSAFGELLKHYEKRVFSLVLRWVRRRDEATELTQEVFLQAFRHQARFDPARPFRPWLFKIAVNACRNHSRHGQRRELPTDAPPEDAPPLFTLAAATPEEGLARAEQRQAILAALAELAPEDRALVLCRFNDGLDYAELSELFGRSQTLLRMRLHRALKRLRSALGDDHHAP